MTGPERKPAAASPEIRIAHESLLRAWGLARELVDADRENLVRLSHVEAQWEHWRRERRSDDLLIPPGLPLEEARKLRRDFADDLDPAIADYIVRSEAADAERVAAEARRRRRERRLTRVALAASILFAVVGVTAGFFYLEAETQTRAAEANAAQAAAERTRAEAEATRAAASAAEALRQAGIATENEAEARRQTASAEASASEAAEARARAEAEARRAEENAAEAERQAELALASGQESRERSAVLSARLSRELAAQGQVDSALVLGLDAAAAFADKPVPDEIRITLERVTRAAEDREDLTLPAAADAVFDVSGEVFLLHNATKRLTRVSDDLTVTPIELGDVVIAEVDASPRDGELLWAGGEGAYGILDLSTNAVETLGTLPEPPPLEAGLSYADESETRVTPTGLVIATTPFGRRDAGGTYFEEELGTLVRLYDRRTDRALAATLDGLALRYGRLDGRELFFNIWTREDEPVLPMWEYRDGGFTETNDLGAGDSAPTRLVLSACMDGAEGNLQGILDSGAFDPENNQFISGCRVSGDAVLVDYVFYGSGGTFESTTLFASSLPGIDVADTARGMAGSEEGMTFPAAVNAMEAAYAPGGEAGLTAFVVNRDVFLFTYERIVGHHRLSEPADFAVFLDDHRLLAGTRASGAAAVFTVRDRNSEAVIGAEEIGSALDRPRLYPGDCSGLNLNARGDGWRTTTVETVEGTIVFSGDESVWQYDPATYRVSVEGEGGERALSIDDVFCVTVSPTGESFAFVSSKTITLYDTAIFAREASFEAAKLMEFNSKKYTHAFLLPDGAGLVAAGVTPTVTLWAPVQGEAKWKGVRLFQSIYAIQGAELDLEGRRLLTVLETGAGFQKMQIQNLAAGLVEAEFPPAYKYGGFGFLADGTVLVQNGGVTEWRPADEAATIAAAEAALTPSCIVEGQPWRDSPCWTQQVAY